MKQYRRRVLKPRPPASPVSSEEKPQTKKRQRSRSKTSRKHFKVAKKAYNEQLDSAIAYCNENGVTPWAALKTERFPLVTDYRVLARKLESGLSSEQHSLSVRILTPDEEHHLVSFALNKNRAFQGLNRADILQKMLEILTVRVYWNAERGGRHYVKLSPAAQAFVSSKTLSQSFWERFESDHPNLRRKRQGSTSVKRAQSCIRWRRRRNT